jgi:hypothetical protein
VAAGDGWHHKGWAFNGYLDVHPVIVSPPPVIVDRPAPQVVKWQVVIDYEGTPEQLEASRQAWTGMNTFLRQKPCCQCAAGAGNPD